MKSDWRQLHSHKTSKQKIGGRGEACKCAAAGLSPAFRGAPDRLWRYADAMLRQQKIKTKAMLSKPQAFLQGSWGEVYLTHGPFLNGHGKQNLWNNVTIQYRSYIFWECCGLPEPQREVPMPPTQLSMTLKMHLLININLKNVNNTMWKHICKRIDFRREVDPLQTTRIK